MSDVPPASFGPIEPVPKVARSRGIRGGRSARRKRQAYQRYVFEISAADNIYNSPEDVPVIHADGRTRPIYRAPEGEPFVVEESEAEEVEIVPSSSPASSRAIPPAVPQPAGSISSRANPPAVPQPAGSIPLFRVGQALQTQPKGASQPAQTSPTKPPSRSQTLQTQPKGAHQAAQTPPKPPNRSKTLQTQPELAQTQLKLPSPPQTLQTQPASSSAPPPKASRARGRAAQYFDLEGQFQCEAFEPIGNKIQIHHGAFDGCLGIVSLDFHEVLDRHHRNTTSWQDHHPLFPRENIDVLNRLSALVSETKILVLVVSYCHSPDTIRHVLRTCRESCEHIEDQTGICPLDAFLLPRKATGPRGKCAVLDALSSGGRVPVVHVDESAEVCQDIVAANRHRALEISVPDKRGQHYRPPGPIPSFESR